MFLPQRAKDALIIDERFNDGGQIPDRFVELLNRPVHNYWGVRDGADWTWPPFTHIGPKVMLINQWSGSGGDCFPYYFKAAGLGPLIGMRTWGGLIGISGVPGLIDGGVATVPTFGFYNVKGEWEVEGHGVDPDIEVVDDPSLMVDGGDPQLDRAIAEALRLLESSPPTRPTKPGYPIRSGR
jgi:tricorn protease